MRLIHENVPYLTTKLSTIERFSSILAEKPFERRNWFIRRDQRFNLSPEDPPRPIRETGIYAQAKAVCVDEGYLTINTEFYPKAIFNYEQTRTDLMAAIDALDTGQKGILGIR